MYNRENSAPGFINGFALFLTATPLPLATLAELTAGTRVAAATSGFMYSDPPGIDHAQDGAPFVIEVPATQMAATIGSVLTIWVPGNNWMHLREVQIFGQPAGQRIKS